jgi:hypothetical protein
LLAPSGLTESTLAFSLKFLEESCYSLYASYSLFFECFRRSENLLCPQPSQLPSHHHNGVLQSTQHSKPGPAQAFLPIEEGKISWYVCGPTVYDHSHLGHARNYISTDIIRRILIHFFGYKVKYVMYITDIDDKVKPIINISIILYGLEQSLTQLNRSYSKPDGRGFWSWRRKNLIPNHKSPSWVAKHSYSMQQAICRR